MKKIFKVKLLFSKRAIKQMEFLEIVIEVKKKTVPKPGKNVTRMTKLEQCLS